MHNLFELTAGADRLVRGVENTAHSDREILGEVAVGLGYCLRISDDDSLVDIFYGLPPGMRQFDRGELV